MPDLRVGSDQTDGRNPGIDLLRGLSILLVLIHHMALRIPLARTRLAAVMPRSLLLALGSDGYEAVFLFFVISGFLITGHALRRWAPFRHWTCARSTADASPASRPASWC